MENNYYCIAKKCKFSHHNSFQDNILILCFQARATYLSVAKKMKAYEDSLYDAWVKEVEKELPGLLKRNLLMKPTEAQKAQMGAGSATGIGNEQGEAEQEAGQ